MVDVYAWNPKIRVFRGRIGRRLPIRRHVNNFGDLLGPIIVEGIARKASLDWPGRDVRLLSVGSVLHEAQDGDVVWGTGINGKIAPERHRFEILDVRAVRGPRTREFLTERGIETPAIYGDPALLLAHVAPHLASPKRTLDVVVVPNFEDLRRHRHRWPREIVKPTMPIKRCLKEITAGRLVVGSSLHALIVAEAFGIPARPVRSEIETPLKYLDYYEGTGRSDVKIAETIDEAVSLGGVEPPQWDATPLIEAFPEDLWT